MKYANTKAANILFSFELDRKLKKNETKNVSVYAVHPGVCDSHLILREFPNIGPFLRKLSSYFIKSPFVGSRTQGKTYFLKNKNLIQILIIILIIILSNGCF